MIGIGKISYPLYLWHWPMLIFLNSYSFGTTTFFERIAAIVVSFILAIVTFHFVEKPIRFGIRARFLPVSLIVYLVLLGIVGLMIATNIINPKNYFINENTLVKKIEQEYAGISYTKNFTDDSHCFLINATYESFDKNGCSNITHPGKESVFLLGDSHAAYLANSLSEYYAKKGINFYEYTAAYCVPLEIDDKRDRCKKINEFIYKKIKDIQPSKIYLFENYVSYNKEESIEHFLSYELIVKKIAYKLLDYGVKDVVIIGQYPNWISDLPKIINKKYLINGDVELPNRIKGFTNKDAIEMEKRLSSTLKNQKNISYISLVDKLCNEPDGCIANLGVENNLNLINFDYGHLTPGGANLLSNYIVKLNSNLNNSLENKRE
jgi:hypothetical protein